LAAFIGFGASGVDADIGGPRSRRKAHGHHVRRDGTRQVGR